MDQHVPVQVADGLRRRGIHARAAYEGSRSKDEDENLLARATELELALFGQDIDFVVIVGQWQASGRGFAGIVYGHQLNLTIG